MNHISLHYSRLIDTLIIGLIHAKLNLEYIVIQIYAQFNEFKKKILYYYVVGMSKCFL